MHLLRSSALLCACYISARKRYSASCSRFPGRCECIDNVVVDLFSDGTERCDNTSGIMPPNNIFVKNKKQPFVDPLFFFFFCWLSNYFEYSPGLPGGYVTSTPWKASSSWHVDYSLKTMSFSWLSRTYLQNIVLTNVEELSSFDFT